MIKILDQNTIDKIAAGEVIERPMSVVKELVENSIDAGSTAVTVEIKDGGISYIRVTDNGSGIEADEVRKAYMRHATSKLETADDLNGIMSLGFRGEALSTIAAVTETEMITKTADSLTGIKYVISGGREVELSEIGAPNGTTIIAKNIFFNTPARLKFLKTAMTESSYINDLMIRIAMSHPGISFKFISNGKNILDTSGNDKLKDTIYAVYGRDITKNLLPVDHEEGNIRISGFVGKPFIAKGNRSFENFFVNGRYITNGVIYKAIEEAYKTYIMQHRFPFTVLFLSLPPEMCDVNIHPTKKEFKYENEKELFTTVYHAVSEALRDRELMPEWKDDETKQSGYGSAQQRVVNNTADTIDKTINNTGITADVSNKPAETVKTESDKNRIISNVETIPAKLSDSVRMNIDNTQRRTTDNKIPGIGKPSHGSYSILEKLLPPEYRSELAEKTGNYSAKQNDTNNDTSVNNNVSENNNAPEHDKAGSGDLINREAENSRIFEGIHKETEEEKIIVGEQKNLFNDDYLSKEALQHHRIIGLAFDTYWITQYNDTLYLMDQHAAHEKVNYERFLKDFKERKIVSQRMFPPEIISLSSVEMDAVRNNLERFNETGFEIDEFGGNEVKISAMPVNLAGLDGRDIFLEFVTYLAGNTSGVTEDIFVHKLATMGCKAAVKGSQRITVEEAQKLIEELLTLDNPYTCPHGRPTIVKYTKVELDKKFKRIVN
ncbi:MAG: DNA mismatch repair endonuclease MutL [Eubacterium sp.]|nr:DNA mismatch repair endonuclease MutL [Eubacterium sp.]